MLAALTWPMLFTTSGFGGDWEHHLWYVWRQSLAIRADQAPSPFLNTSYSVLYPLYAFYGGTIYVIAGALSVVLGNSPLAAYVLSYLLGFLAAYGGWYWAGRIVGLGRWLAHGPALVFVSSAYYLTLVYGIGDWPEFLALSMLPLMIAAALSVLRAEQLRVLPALALTVSSTVFFGSHVLTVLWACTLLGLIVVVVVTFVPEARLRIRRPGLRRVVVLVVPALLVNAWFLAPMAAYASHTQIGSQYDVATTLLREYMQFVSFRDLFTLSRATTVPGRTGDALCLPTLAMVWALASIAILPWRARRGTWMRLLLIFAAATAGIVVLMTQEGLLLALPKPYTQLEFSYRLEGYVLMGVAATVMSILVLAQSRSGGLRLWSWTIVPVLIFSTIGAIQQVSAYPRTPLPRSATLTYRGEIFAQKFDDYSYVPLPLISAVHLPKLHIAPRAIHGNHVSFTAHVHPGQLVATNIGGGPDLLNVTGASIAGTDEHGHLVLAVGSTASAGLTHPPTAVVSDVHVSISPAQSLPVVLGRLLAFAGVIVLLVGFLMLIARRGRAFTSSQRHFHRR
jgi:hypothetical protein